MNQQQRFEAFYAKQHDIDPEDVEGYRMGDSYRLPGIAAHYRTFKAAEDGLPKYAERHKGHAIPQWLRDHFDSIEMRVNELRAEGTFTQMRTKVQAYFEMVREQCEPMACVIAFREGVKEPELLSWNQLPVGEHRLYAEQPAPVSVVPEGYCIMPRRLTAENGAKALLLGEFQLTVTMECPECVDMEEPSEGCEICDGEGEYGQKHMIPWDKIKFIYSEAVKGLAIQQEATDAGNTEG